MKVVILAGGLGTRLSEYTKVIPKPMVQINKKPIIHRIIDHYISYGFNDFYIAVGYKGEVLRKYFSKKRFNKKVKINLINTGKKTMTGGRLKRLKKFLNENNFLVTTADSAEDAYDKTQYVKFDLIILDIMMPGKSGLDFLNEYKKDIDTPVILLTAKGEPNERIEGLEMGADDYLPKPFEPKELDLRIKNIIKKKSIFQN